MTKTSKTILFFGTEDFSLAALEGLIKAGYKIGAVITKPDSPRGRGRKLTPPAVKVLAQKHDIPVLQPQKLRDIEGKIAEFDSPAGVLSSYGKIIPKSTLDLFTPGIINIHPSLLPKYRGPSPIESAILNGDELTGVSIIKLVAEMDAGPIYAQAKVPLTGNETKPALYEQLAKVGVELLLEHLSAIVSGDLTPHPQNDSSASYCQLLEKADGLLDPSTLKADEAERRVRAYLNYPKSRLETDYGTIIITKAHTSKQPKTPLDAQFQDDNYLVVDELIASSGRKMDAEAYLRGAINR